MPNKRHLLIVIALSLAVLVGSCSPNPQPPGLTPIPTLAPGETVTLVSALQNQGGVAPSTPAVRTQASAALGVVLFQFHCALCHGVQAEGVTAPALQNSQYVQTGGVQGVITTVANGLPGTKMGAWSQRYGGPLTDAQISDVVAYVDLLQAAAPAQAATEPAARPLPKRHHPQPR